MDIELISSSLDTKALLIHKDGFAGVLTPRNVKML
jgi:hypothetical protein